MLSPTAARVYYRFLSSVRPAGGLHMHAAGISEQCVAVAIYSNRCCNMQHDPYMPQKCAREDTFPMQEQVAEYGRLTGICTHISHS